MMGPFYGKWLQVVKEKGKLIFSDRVGLVAPSVRSKKLFPPKDAGTKIWISSLLSASISANNALKNHFLYDVTGVGSSDAGVSGAGLMTIGGMGK